LVNVKAINGEPLVKGKHMKGFSNTEEEAVQLTKVVLLLEDELTKQGAHCSKEQVGNLCKTRRPINYGSKSEFFRSCSPIVVKTLKEEE
jgi:hypothetical protein